MIVAFPDERLRAISIAVADNEDVGPTIADMIDAMYAADGVGISAVQIGVMKRIVVIDVSGVIDPVAYINPEIVHRSITTDEFSEGCLSIGGVEATITRPSDIIVRYLDRDGELRVQAMDGLLARCMQHEVDHLDGMLILDHLSDFKRKRALKKLGKMA